MNSRLAIHKKTSRTGLDFERYGGFKSDGARYSTASSQPYQRRQTAQPPWKRPPVIKKLDYSKFMSLPADIMLRVCRFLYPCELLALARTNRSLRAKFMKEVSRPYWNATLYLPGMPDWKTVASPQAAVTIYESQCQRPLCNEESSVLAFHVGRRYCLNCAEENLLDLEEATQQFPSAPEDLVRRLPWTARRTPPPDLSTEKQRFYLKSDIERLCRRLDGLNLVDKKSMLDLGQELSAFQKQREKSTKEVKRWHEQDSRRRQKTLNQRWRSIADVMKSRWGWKPVEYDRLGPRLKNIVDYLLDAPTLGEETWGYVRGDLEWAIKEEASFRSRSGDARRFSLSIPLPDPEGNTL